MKTLLVIIFFASVGFYQLKEAYKQSYPAPNYASEQCITDQTTLTVLQINKNTKPDEVCDQVYKAMESCKHSGKNVIMPLVYFAEHKQCI